MGIFRDLLGNVANAKMAEQQSQLAYNQNLGDLLTTVIQNPNTDPTTFAKAKEFYVDLLGKHGGKQARAVVPQISQFLTLYGMQRAQQLRQQEGGGAEQQQAPGTPPPISPDIAGAPQRPGAPQRAGMPGAAGPAALTGQQGETAATAPPPPPQHRGPLSMLAGVGENLLGIPRIPRDRQLPSKALFQMTPDEQRTELRREGAKAGLTGEALDYFALTGKPPSDWGKGAGPTDTEIQQGLDQFDRMIAPQLRKSGVDEQRIAAARLQWAGGVKLGAPPPEKLYSYTDPATNEPRTVVRSGGVWRDANTGAQVELPANASPMLIGQQRATSAAMQFRQDAFGAYASEVLHNPGAQLTDLQKLDAINWAKRRSETDPEWAARFTPVTKTIANPEGDPYIEMMAQEFIVNDKVPAGGMSGKGFPRQQQIVRRADEMLQMAGYSRGDLMTIREGIKANNKAFDRVVTQGSALATFEGTVRANAQQVRTLSEMYDRTNYPLANRLWDAWNNQGGGTEANNLAAQMHILAIEWAKVMSGAMSNANVPVTSAADAEAIMSRYLSNHQLNELLDNVILPDMNNRVNAQNDEKQQLQNAIRNFATLTPQEPTGGAATMPPPAGQTPAPTPPAAPAPSAPRGAIGATGATGATGVTGPTGARSPTGDPAVDYLKRHPPPRRR